jgi:hypothetical protein
LRNLRGQCHLARFFDAQVGLNHLLVVFGAVPRVVRNE